MYHPNAMFYAAFINLKLISEVRLREKKTFVHSSEIFFSN